MSAFLARFAKDAVRAPMGFQPGYPRPVRLSPPWCESPPRARFSRRTTVARGRTSAAAALAAARTDPPVHTPPSIARIMSKAVTQAAAGVAGGDSGAHAGFGDLSEQRGPARCASYAQKRRWECGAQLGLGGVQRRAWSWYSRSVMFAGGRVTPRQARGDRKRVAEERDRTELKSSLSWVEVVVHNGDQLLLKKKQSLEEQSLWPRCKVALVEITRKYTQWNVWTTYLHVDLSAVLGLLSRDRERSCVKENRKDWRGKNENRRSNSSIRK
ncbi:hypothetical protein DFJ73DRAFT_764218 [Zopfochytrium polystomum]|nr:hypothetical protein DFJ73DRAFT_764218 [Zopfochytrium polystomum]